MRETPDHQPARRNLGGSQSEVARAEPAAVALPPGGRRQSHRRQRRGFSMKALQIESFGNAAEVVKAVDIPDVGKPAAGEVVMALEGSRSTSTIF